MADEAEPEGLSEIEIALLDALKTTLEMIIHVAPGSERYLARAFAHQRDAKLQTAQPDAAAVFELLQRFVADPERGLGGPF